MEALKPKNQLAEPDERYLFFIHSESKSEAKRLGLDDLYEEVEGITLNQNVPDHVRNHFQQARHLTIYHSIRKDQRLFGDRFSAGPLGE